MAGASQTVFATFFAMSKGDVARRRVKRAPGHNQLQVVDPTSNNASASAELVSVTAMQQNAFQFGTSPEYRAKIGDLEGYKKQLAEWYALTSQRQSSHNRVVFL